MNNQRYIIMAFLGGAAFAGFAVRGLAIPLLASLDIADPQVLGLINATSLVGIVVAVTSFLGLLRHQVAYQFADESCIEIRKTTFETRPQTVRATGVVIGTTVFIASTLAAYDFLWGRITRTFIFTDG